jgi:hypothetical protein
MLFANTAKRRPERLETWQRQMRSMMVNQVDIERSSDHGRSADADKAPTGVALVPLTPPVGSRVTCPRLSRADFLTHLIATAAQAPQTRGLRRATPADAEIAYAATQRPLPGLGIRTRQVI